MIVRCGIHGFGTVGVGVAKVMQMHRVPLPVSVPFIVDSQGALIDPEGIDLPSAVRAKETADLRYASAEHFPGMGCVEAVEEVGCDVLIECTPTDIENGGTGLTAVRAALERGIHVVTANKGPLVVAYPDLVSLARREGVDLRFSATVCGAVPALEVVGSCLRSCRVVSVEGILNGCTNYILTRMEESGKKYTDILDEARALGIAERDPEFDVGGWDTAAKLVILTDLVYGKHMDIREIRRKGITDVTPEDVASAKRTGRRIKLVGYTDGRSASVRPRLVAVDSLLDVGGTRNIIVFNTDLAGEIAVSGRGAGQMETASSVMSDLIVVLSRISGKG